MLSYILKHLWGDFKRCWFGGVDFTFQWSSIWFLVTIILYYLYLCGMNGQPHNQFLRILHMHVMNICGVWVRPVAAVTTIHSTILKKQQHSSEKNMLKRNCGTFIACTVIITKLQTRVKCILVELMYQMFIVKKKHLVFF